MLLMKTPSLSASSGDNAHGDNADNDSSDDDLSESTIQPVNPLSHTDEAP